MVIVSTEPVRVERRVGQRFEVHLPVLICVAGQTMGGFTQNVSARGAFLFAEGGLPDGATVELTFTMPSEITLAESMRVRCIAHVLRRTTSGAGQRSGIAVHLNSYEYLPESEPAAPVGRISSATPTTETPSNTMPRG